MDKNTNKELLSAYLIIGDDENRKNSLLQKIKERVDELGEGEFNTEIFDCENLDIENVISSCLTLPFACEKRLIVLRDVDKLNTEEVTHVLDYLDSPCSTTILFMIAKKVAKNTKLYKKVDSIDKNSIIHCDSPKPYEFKNYIIQQGNKLGIKFAPAAAQRLVDFVGEDTLLIENEIKKIKLAHNTSKEVNVAEIESLIANRNEIKPWVLVDAISARNAGQTFTYLPKVTGTTPIGILYLCTTRLRELLCAKYIDSQGQGVEQLATELGFSPAQKWRVKNHIAWSRQYSEEELVSGICKSIECEKKMKSGQNQLSALVDWLLVILSKN